LEEIRSNFYMKSVAKTVGSVMVIMIFSRLLAFFSNLIYVTYFGANTKMDIFTFALNIPNIVFTSLGTALTTIVIPIFAAHIADDNREKAFIFADNILSLSTVFTLVLALLGMMASPLIVALTRFKNEDYGFAVMALCVMLPIMVFYAMNYIYQGILQSLGKFAMPAFVSVPSSIAVILYVLVLGNRFGVNGLLFASFTGLALQGLVLVYPAYKAGYRYHVRFDYRSEDIVKALKLMPPVFIGTSAYQLNMLFNNVVASRFESMNTIMNTIQNMVLYSALAFVYSVTAVVYPKFTMQVAKNEMEEYKTSLLRVLKSIIYFMIPAAVGFIFVSRQLVNFFMAWNKITPENVNFAAKMMELYAASIIGLGIKEVVDRAFYSLKDTKTPAINGVIIMAVNISLSVILIQFIGPLGIPLAYSISALTGGIVLMYLMRRKIGAFGIKKLVASSAKVIVSSAIMAIAVFSINRLLLHANFGRLFVDRGIKLFIPAGAGMIIYCAATYLLNVEEAVDALKSIKRKLGLTI
jgi:putative peptidoglycan lipid II flippase